MADSTAVLAIVEPDISPREVVDRSAWLANLTGSTLELLLCDADVGPLGDMIFVSNEARDIAEQIRAAQEAMLEELAQSARDRGVGVASGILDMRPIADGIVHVALDRKPRYVVKATQYHSDAERAFLLDTDWQLIRNCPFPLWLVKPRPIAEKPVIIAAVDPMHSEDEQARLDGVIIEHGKAIAAQAGGELQLLHAYQPMRGVAAAARLNFKPVRLPVDEISRKMEKEHRARLDALAAEHGIAPDRTHQLPGSPRDLLPYLAREWNADLVVMGAVARGRGSGGAIGRTAERVLDHLPCDVLILRPDTR
ncbi:MAG TPA: universal stress protein [Woeseiaceae bacterium]|nr:universal stress protein [Woeseiaceae bacterium]